MSLHRGLGLIALLLLTVCAQTQNDGGNGAAGKHDLNGQACATCHASQGPSLPRPETAGNCDNTPLWDCDLLSRNFPTYDAALAAGNDAATAAPADDAQVRMSSMLCASCHDGVSTSDMNRGGRAKGPSLQSEHPVDVQHDPTRNASLAPVLDVIRQVKLYRPGNKVQCTTCHEVHDNTDRDLLRTPNTNSSLCVVCHL